MGRGQSQKIFLRNCTLDFLKGCMWISQGKKESRFESKAGIGENGKLSVSSIKSEKPMGLPGEMPCSLGLPDQVLPQDRSVPVVRRWMVSKATRLDECTKAVVQRRGVGSEPQDAKA